MILDDGSLMLHFFFFFFFTCDALSFVARF